MEFLCTFLVCNFLSMIFRTQPFMTRTWGTENDSFDQAHREGMLEKSNSPRISGFQVSTFDFNTCTTDSMAFGQEYSVTVINLCGGRMVGPDATVSLIHGCHKTNILQYLIEYH